MSNNNKYLVRIKTLAELIKYESEPPDEYIDEEHEIYQMFKKYGGKKLWVWVDIADRPNSYYSDKVLDDEELEASRDNRLFYKNELVFLPNTRIELDNNLFEL